MIDTDAIAAKLSAKVRARYRAAAAIHHVTGIDSGSFGKYGPMVSLFNLLKRDPGEAERTARFHAENFSREAVSGQAERAEAIAVVLDQTSHEDDDVREWLPEHPAEVARAAAALHEYARVVRACLT